MRSTMLRGFWVAVVSLMIVVPSYAYAETTNGGNGGLGNGMGTSTHGMHDGITADHYRTETYVQSNNGHTMKATPNHDVSVYGTGTGNQFLNVNANEPAATDRNQGYRTQSYANGGFRALQTTTSSRGTGWGWLGLLGLIGLFGLRSRNPQRDR